MKDKKIFSLLVLVMIVAIFTVFLLAVISQTGYTVKENGEEGKKSSLKLIGSNKETEQTTTSTNPTTTGNIIKIGSSRSSGSNSSRGSSGRSSSGNSRTSTTNPPPNPPTNPKTSQATIELSVNPSTSTQQKDNEFIIKVSISSQEEIYAAEFELTYNTEVLQLSSVTKGDFLNSDGANTYEVIQNESGIVKFASTRFSTQTGVSGQGTLAIIKFKAKNPGTSDLILAKAGVTDTSLNTDKFKINKLNGKIIVA